MTATPGPWSFLHNERQVHVSVRKDGLIIWLLFTPSVSHLKTFLGRIQDVAEGVAVSLGSWKGKSSFPCKVNRAASGFAPWYLNTKNAALHLQQMCEQRQRLLPNQRRLVPQTRRDVGHVVVHQGRIPAKCPFYQALQPTPGLDHQLLAAARYLTQRSARMMTTLLRMTGSEETSSSRASAATLRFATSSCCRHSFPERCVQSIMSHTGQYSAHLFAQRQR